jgi:hypothetical protein
MTNYLTINIYPKYHTLRGAEYWLILYAVEHELDKNQN